MTVHMIQLRCEVKNNITEQQVHDTCEAWAANYSETLTTERLSITRVPADEGTTAHYHGAWRFVWGEDRVALLDHLQSDLNPRVTWARIDYHACTHDEDQTTRPGCAWNTEAADLPRIIGTPPADITP